MPALTTQQRIHNCDQESKEAMQQLRAARFTTEQVNALAKLIDSQATAKAILIVDEYHEEMKKRG